VESIDHDLGGIVGRNVLAPGHASANFIRLLVPADERGVQVLLVESEVDVSVLGGLGAIGWLASNKATDLYHVGDTLVRMHFFEVGECGRRVDAGNVDSRRRRGKHVRDTTQDEACDAANHELGREGLSRCHTS